MNHHRRRARNTISVLKFSCQITSYLSESLSLVSIFLFGIQDGRERKEYSTSLIKVPNTSEGLGFNSSISLSVLPSQGIKGDTNLKNRTLIYINKNINLHK